MKAEIEQKIIYKLTLNELEAAWLRALVQNPLCSPDLESNHDREMRLNFFNAVSNDVKKG